MPEGAVQVSMGRKRSAVYTAVTPMNQNNDQNGKTSLKEQ